MAAILTSFMNELKEESSSPEKTIENKNDNVVNKGGCLIISGCVDWDRQLGYKGNDSISLEEPMVIKFNQNVLKSYSSSSSFHLFIQLLDGSIFGLGRNKNGQLGCDHNNTQHTPIRIAIPENNTKVTKISTGSKHSILLLDSGNVYAAGCNVEGACGLGGDKKAIKDFYTFTKIESLKNIIDIACGDNFSIVCDRDGNLYSFGHPEYGQLGLGSNGEYIQKAGKISYSYVFQPTLITKFVQKNVVFGNNKARINEINEKIKFVKVAAGKNHVLALENWENSSRGNRLFSWGNSGYGRTGLNTQDDELFPVEIAALSDPEHKNITKHIRDISCGSTFSIAISNTRNLYYFGKISNAPRSEATMYPKMLSELVGYPIRHGDCGQNCIMLSSSDMAIGWGVSVSGKFGFQGDVKGSTIPTFISKVNGLYICNISCGQYHTCMVVTEDELPAVDTGGHSSFCHKSQGDKVSMKDIPVWIDVVVESNEKIDKKRKSQNNENNKKQKKLKK